MKPCRLCIITSLRDPCQGVKACVKEESRADHLSFSQLFILPTLIQDGLLLTRHPGATASGVVAPLPSSTSTFSGEMEPQFWAGWPGEVEACPEDMTHCLIKCLSHLRFIPAFRQGGWRPRSHVQAQTLPASPHIFPPSPIPNLWVPLLPSQPLTLAG